jgi:hypothetical protein
VKVCDVIKVKSIEKDQQPVGAVSQQTSNRLVLPGEGNGETADVSKSRKHGPVGLTGVAAPTTPNSRSCMPFGPPFDDSNQQLPVEGSHT